MEERIIDRFIDMQEEFDDVYFEKARLEYRFDVLTKKATKLEEMLLEQCLNTEVLLAYKVAEEIKVVDVIPPLANTEKLLDIVGYQSMYNFLIEKWYELQTVEVDCNE